MNCSLKIALHLMPPQSPDRQTVKITLTCKDRIRKEHADMALEKVKDKFDKPKKGRFGRLPLPEVSTLPGHRVTGPLALV